MKKRHAFTLIELLVVIAIIAILAALVVNMVGAAKKKQHAAQVSGARSALMTMIDNYQSKLNFYPPDNGFLATFPPGTYDAYTATNPLLYELTGATNNDNDPAYTGQIRIFNSPPDVAPLTYKNVFNRTAVNNGNSDEPHDFYIPGPQTKDYASYNMGGLSGLVAPITYSPTVTNGNFWHYDSSTTNRHNINTYDLWAEYMDGTNIITNCNW